jgi:large subunit ribosomal protein L10
MPPFVGAASEKPAGPLGCRKSGGGDLHGAECVRGLALTNAFVSVSGVAGRRPVNKQQKQARVDRLRDELGPATGIVVATYKGLSVAHSTDLRVELRKSESRLRMVKNTLARLSVQGTNHEALAVLLTGSNFIAFGRGPVAPAKVLVKAAKDAGDRIVITGGVLNGKLLSAAEVEALSKLPGLNELRGKFLGMLAAVPQKFVNQLAAVPRGMVTVLSQRMDKLEEGAA